MGELGRLHPVSQSRTIGETFVKPEATLAKRVPPLSPALLAKLKPDPTRTIELVDGDVPGLRLRITPAGARTWSLNIRANGVMRRFDVGKELGLKEARQTARRVRHEVSVGRDPTAERRTRRAAELAAKDGIGTFSSVVEVYFSSGPGGALRTKSEQLQRIRSVFAAQWRRPAKDVKSATLQHCVDVHGGKVAAARATGYLRPVLKWAVKRDLVTGPFDLEVPSAAPPRQRVLDRDEIALLLPALADEHGVCAKFMLLTGARRDEARDATWEQIDLQTGTWTIPGEQRKDSRSETVRRKRPKSPLLVPLPRQAVVLLHEVRGQELSRRRMQGEERALDVKDRIFVGVRGGRLGNWDRWLKSVYKRTGVTSWSLHSLRRTTATLAGDLGVPPHVVSVLLGHANVGGHLIAGYNQSRYFEDHAEAMQKIADCLDAITGAAK